MLARGNALGLEPTGGEALKGRPNLRDSLRISLGWLLHS